MSDNDERKEILKKLGGSLAFREYVADQILSGKELKENDVGGSLTYRRYVVELSKKRNERLKDNK